MRKLFLLLFTGFTLSTAGYAAQAPYTDAGALQSALKGNAVFRCPDLPTGEGLNVTWPASSLAGNPAVTIVPQSPALSNSFEWQAAADNQLQWIYQWKTDAGAESAKWGMGSGESGFSAFPTFTLNQVAAAPQFTTFENQSTPFNTPLTLSGILTNPELQAAVLNAGGRWTVEAPEGAVANVSINETTGAITFTPIAVGTSTYTLSLAESAGKWTSATESIIVTVTPLSAPTLTWTTTPADRYYSASVPSFEAAATPAAGIIGSVTYSFSDDGGTTWDAAPLNVGSYQVKASAVAAAGYSPVADLTASFAIVAKEATLAFAQTEWAIPYASISTLPTVAMTSSDIFQTDIDNSNVILGNATVDASGFSQYGSGVGSTFDVRSATPTGVAAGNYNWTPAASAAFNITKNESLSVTLAGMNQTSGLGIEYTIVPPATTPTDVIQPTYVYTTNPVYTVIDGKFTPTTADVVTVTATPSSPNYNVSPVTFTVTPTSETLDYSTLTVTLADGNTMFDGNTKGLKIIKTESSEEVSGITAVYSWTPPAGSASQVSELRNAGTYVVTLTSAAYAFTGTKPTLTITPKTAQLAITAPNSIVYGHDASASITSAELVAGDAFEPTIAGSDYTVWSTGVGTDNVTFTSVTPAAMTTGLLSNYTLTPATSVPTSVTPAAFTIAGVESPIHGVINQTMEIAPVLDFTGFSAVTANRPSGNFTIDVGANAEYVTAAGKVLSFKKLTAVGVDISIKDSTSGNYTVTPLTVKVIITEESLQSGTVWLSSAGNGNGASFAAAANISRFTEACSQGDVAEIRIADDVEKMVADVDLSTSAVLKLSSGWKNETAQNDEKAVFVTGGLKLANGQTVDKVIIDASAPGKSVVIPNGSTVTRCTLKVNAATVLQGIVTSSIVFGAAISAAEGNAVNITASALEGTANYGDPITSGSSSFWLAPEGSTGDAEYFMPKVDADFMPTSGSVLVNRGASAPTP